MQKVLLGATGETGGSILNGLLEFGNFVSYLAMRQVFYLMSVNRKSQLLSDLPPLKSLMS